MHTQSFPYTAQPAYYLEDTVSDLTQEPDWAAVRSPSTVYSAGMKGKNRIGKDAVAEEKMIYLFRNSGYGADITYISEERSDTGENRRGKRFRQNKKRD